MHAAQVWKNLSVLNAGSCQSLFSTYLPAASKIMSRVLTLHFWMQLYFSRHICTRYFLISTMLQSAALKGSFSSFVYSTCQAEHSSEENKHPDTHRTHSATSCPPMMNFSSKEHSSGSQWTHKATLPDNWMSSRRKCFAGQTAGIMQTLLLRQYPDSSSPVDAS